MAKRTPAPKMPNLMYFDRSQLKTMDAKEAARLVNANYTDFLEPLAARLLGGLPKTEEEKKSSIRPTQQAFFGAPVEEFLDLNSSLDVTPRFPVAHLLAYLVAYNPNVSAERLVFENPLEGVVLNERLDYLCKLVASFPNSEYTGILKILEENISISNNPCYTLYTRLEELASFYRTNAKILFNPLLFCMYAHNVGMKLLQPMNPVTTSLTYYTRYDSNSKDSDASMSYRAFLLAIFVANAYDVSLDYLLVRDYSEQARFADRSMNEREKRFLSLYLGAEASAREEVLAKIFSVSARQWN